MGRIWAIIDWPFKWGAYLLIQAYRYTLSALVGRNCRHAPTCSEFTRDAILSHGFWPGGWMGAGRIWRCRPGGTHGYDPVPKALPSGARWYLPWRYGRWRGKQNDEHQPHA
ncbi:membrane protein insertion efficiency factor YidD [Pelagibacterium flavum]|uniref:Putative membrane protein insertion efficiency factor n=1 Tax=Pelagibacterium flavum TaxID=2984530 RepID=A0ABY6IT82_9HYPH|nr:membrane protein insertion efficiency factor YidD [Pelagibacterium sp. YIM 151497]MAN77546.1 membrane protein insertion efficiency factor YidD [Hyphomicrobiales bacterium]UYQ73846.1 membrane protein insertion efficiency factor YidD [Pelagibacterium sp. YIM 151497]|tara:strand:+ start:460 stop:792 length:333 start_codon:yes stop_codon:yes gene_type:complete